MLKLTMVTLLSLLGLFSNAVFATEYQKGVQYTEIALPVPVSDKSRIEVVELFGYPCPHCNSFEPLLEHWDANKAEDVNFVRIPVVFGRSWEPLARAYYTAELLGIIDKTHKPMFDAVHIEKRRFAGVDQLAEFYAPFGVDTETFKKQYGSFAVNMKLKQGESKIRGYGITGVPSLVVGGKYLVTAGSAGGHKEMLEVVDYLVESLRAK